MTWEPRPIPPVTPETESFWEATTHGRLLIGDCQACDEAFYYPREHCPYCFADDVALTEAAGTGNVYSYTVGHQIDEWPEDKLPVIIAYVELEEGPRIMTNIIGCEPEEVEIGAAVEVDFITTDDEDLAIPVFRLAD
jgi:uncharacterized OB-fold protein